MSTQDNLIISQPDFERLSSLVKSASSEIVELLEEELSRASIVPPSDVPSDVVSMNSKVRFENLETGKENEVTLVYPHEANIQENKISILTPIGSALIGLRVGQTIEWPFPDGSTKKLKVISVEHR